MPWLEDLVNDPASTLRLEVEPEQQLVPAFDHPRVRLTLGNVGQHPLAVSASAPINPRVLMTPSIVLGGVRYPNDLRETLVRQVLYDAFTRNLPITRPQAERVADQRLSTLEKQLLEVLRFEDRLRLSPGESVTTELDLAHVPLGTVVQQSLGTRMRFRWRASHGFVASAGPVEQGGSSFVAGPQSISAETPLIVRASVPVPGELGGIPGYLEGASGDRLLACVLHTVGLASLASEASAEDVAQLAAADRAAAGALSRLTRLERDLVHVQLVEMAVHERMPELTAALAGEVDGETHPALLGMLLVASRPLEAFMTRDELLDLGSASSSGGIRDLATMIRNAQRALVEGEDDLENINETGLLEEAEGGG